jgi:hypothetical protein
MIEIIGGKLYVSDYFMIVKSEADYVKIAKPSKLLEWEFIPTNNTHWLFKRVRTLHGDTRWQLDASPREFGSFIDYYVDRVFNDYGLGV